MKLNCTKGPLLLWPHIIRGLYTDAEMRSVFDEQRQAFLANVISARRPDTKDVIISEKERDANANLFALAPEMLQLLLDQQALHDRLSTLTYDEAVTANMKLISRGEVLLARLKAAGVIGETGQSGEELP